MYLITLCVCVSVCVVCVSAHTLSRVQLFVTPMDRSLPGSSVYEISEAGILEWVAISFSRGFSQPRNCTQVYAIYYYSTLKRNGILIYA